MIEIRVVSINGAPPSQAMTGQFDESGGTLGRSDTNTLILSDPDRHVSRLQARVAWTNGRFELENVGANPLDIDGRSVISGESVPLVPGARITIGGFVLAVLACEEERPDIGQEPDVAMPSQDPLGLFADLSTPASAASDPFELLGGSASTPDAMPTPGRSAVEADPFALFETPGDSRQGLMPPSPAPSRQPDSEFIPPESSAQGPANVIPDDFDPFADPFAQRPSVEASPTLDDLGFGEQKSAEASELDDLFGLSPSSQASGADPFADSRLGDWPADRQDADMSSDPLAALSPDSAHPMPPPTIPDQVPEIKGAFVPPPPSGGQAFLSWEQEPSSIGSPPPAPPPLAPAPESALCPESSGPSVSDSADPSSIGPIEETEEVSQVRIPGGRVPESSNVRLAASAPGKRLARDESHSPGLADRSPPFSPSPGPMTNAELASSSGVKASSMMPGTTGAGGDALTQAFLNGLGLEDSALKLPAGMTPEMMERVGRLLREATAGTLDLLVARAMTKREMRAEVTMIVSRDNNPLKFSPNADVALAHLLAPQGKGFMAPTDAMRDAYEDLRAHQIGFMAGMRAALEGVLARFDPDTLQRRLSDKSMLDSLLPMNRRAKLWDLYTEMFHDIASEAEDDFHALFGRAFLRAYEEHVKRLDEEH